MLWPLLTRGYEQNHFPAVSQPPWWFLLLLPGCIFLLHMALIHLSLTPRSTCNSGAEISRRGKRANLWVCDMSVQMVKTVCLFDPGHKPHPSYSTFTSTKHISLDWSCNYWFLPTCKQPKVGKVHLNHFAGHTWNRFNPTMTQQHFIIYVGLQDPRI